MRKSEITQNKILLAAENLFFKKPVSKVSMSSIAIEAGVAKGTIYLYFECKEDIVWAIMDKYLRVFSGLFNQLDYEVVNINSVNRLLDQIFDFIDDNYTTMYGMHQLSFVDFVGKDRVEKKYEDLWRVPIIKFLENGVRQGIFDIINIDFYAHFLFASLHGMFDSFILDQSNFSAETLRFEFKEIVRKLLR